MGGGPGLVLALGLGRGLLFQVGARSELAARGAPGLDLDFGLVFGLGLG